MDARTLLSDFATPLAGKRMIREFSAALAETARRPHDRANTDFKPLVLITCILQKGELLEHLPPGKRSSP
jgi:hypothetical protein